jgi:beta-galactosidase
MRLFLLFIIFVIHVPALAQRFYIDMNTNWQFHLADSTSRKDTGMNTLHKWRTVELAHDWSIEGKYSEHHPATTQGGALPGGIATYTTRLHMPKIDSNRHVTIEFDGIYQKSEVWVNGHFLGERPNGYISFQYDLTPYIKDGDVELFVRVDNSAQPNSRWYTGSGIYRPARLMVTSAIAVDHWGTFVTTPQVSRQSANVQVAIVVRNARKGNQPVRIETSIYNAAWKMVGTKASTDIVLKDSLTEIMQDLVVQRPRLWSVDSPYLYNTITRIFQGDREIDKYTTTFGIRYFNFDAQKGFSLNGKPLKILGVCNHHDLGPLGAAINIRAMERQLEILKAMGCNAIRMAHNPPASHLLDLCDQMGFLVMDEAFDVWKKRKNRYDYHLDFDKWHKRDLEDMIKRDRNHPSVIMWSIGNEIREQFDTSGIRLTRELTQIVKQLDTTRPVTAALTETDSTKNFMYQANVLDVIGLNYNHTKYDSLPRLFPGKKIIASETTSGLASRGHYDMPSDSVRYWPARGDKFVKNGNPDHTVSAYDNVAAYWGSTHETSWKGVKKNDFISGLFVWTGFDYLGEPTPYPWPARSSYFGIIDLAGFPKDVYYMYQSEWTSKPVLHIFPHWNWTPGKLVGVWAYYNNADEVELFLNGRSLGIRRKQNDDLHVQWSVPFEPGTLTAISRKNGKKILQKTIKTAGAPAAIKLVADRNILQNWGRDLSFITVQVTDAEGNLVPDADNLVTFELSGWGWIAGVENGNPASAESSKVRYRKAYKGLCLAIVQAIDSGRIRLTAKSPGLVPATIALKVSKKKQRFSRP